jgi:hypothetical protein
MQNIMEAIVISDITFRHHHQNSNNHLHIFIYGNSFKMQVQNLLFNINIDWFSLIAHCIFNVHGEANSTTLTHNSNPRHSCPFYMT